MNLLLTGGHGRSCGGGDLIEVGAVAASGDGVLQEIGGGGTSCGLGGGKIDIVLSEARKRALMLMTCSVGFGSKTMMSSRRPATCSRPLMASLVTLTNQPVEVLLSCGITGESNSRVGVQNAIKRMVSSSVVSNLMERGNQVEEGNAPFAQGVENLVKKGDGRLSEGVDGVQLIVVICKSDTTAFSGGITTTGREYGEVECWIRPVATTGRGRRRPSWQEWC